MLFNIQGSSCYDINATCILSPKVDLLKFVKFEFGHVFSLSCIWKKDGNAFGKNTVTSWYSIAYMVNSFVTYQLLQLWI